MKTYVRCATEDYTCPYCDANAICMMSTDPAYVYRECDDMASAVIDVNDVYDVYTEYIWTPEDDKRFD